MRLPLLFGLVVAWVGVAWAQVGPAVETGHARSRLAAETMSAAPGMTVTIGLMQVLDDHWHVYWRNPGDSGLPLNLSWRLPEGYVAGDVAYPLPHRLPLGPLVNFGHEGEPVFLIDLTVPETAVVGTTASIKVDAEWLICADICVPENATLSLLLPITAEPGPPTMGIAAKIAAARAEQPLPASFSAAFFDGEAGPTIVLTDAPEGALEFYPYAPSLIEPSAPVVEARSGNQRSFTFVKGFVYDAAVPDSISGVVVTDKDGLRVGYTFRAPRISPPQLPPSGAGSGAAGSDAAGGLTLLPAIGLAVLGGIILNVMPCVFPIIFLKAAGIAGLPRSERGAVRRYGLVYTLGVLTTFAALAAALLILRAGGAQLGWGFHLQSPVAVAMFALLIFLIGLNFVGVFAVGSSLQGAGEGLTQKKGVLGAYFTGVLAVAVAAPCIGPFLGGAMGLALTRPGVEAMAIFLAIGAGLAAPYLLICLVPGIARLLPRPGPWMEVMKVVFAFAMFATVVWLLWVLSHQAGSDGVAALGATLVLGGLAAWLYGRGQSGARPVRWIAAAAAVFGVSLLPVIGLSPRAEATPSTAKLIALAYDEAVLSTLVADGTPVFVDFTAAWCVSCQFNKRTVLDRREVVEAFSAAGASYMVADWTSRDPMITAALERHGRAGVPLYVYYGADEGPPRLLPALLSVDMMVSLLGGDGTGEK